MQFYPCPHEHAFQAFAQALSSSPTVIIHPIAGATPRLTTTGRVIPTILCAEQHEKDRSRTDYEIDEAELLLTDRLSLLGNGKLERGDDECHISYNSFIGSTR